ncbi:hypothetical protein DACRYDRAFT_111646 [Dacryopinax primogenitus]|uniref:Flavodoxin-like domain-containing protein n=1 Tax=Dacryopinax primogenitus (strain DJM 731) TaxID=1858805 RepID=M5FQI6_DACPD|nr:uncharacterized protein DACRYDRAFT_111646 [Dacryopinax primogenitus]EJT97748.1 hypothetical protein DACRYDRAFT_111646 [Dacryopinax primogenitus]
MPAKIAVIYYSMYGHIKQLAEKAVEGVKSAGASVTLYQFPETLNEEILGKMHAPPKDAAVPIITPADLKEYDGIIFAFPTRYGRAVAQASAFFDATGQLWATGALVGKFAATIVSTATQNGGQETTHLTTMPFFAHHGLIYVPIGYVDKNLFNLQEIHGGSPWGASTMASSDGSRQPTDLEKSVAEYQGKYFAGVVNTYVAGKAAQSAAAPAPAVAALEVPASAQNPAEVHKEAGGYDLELTTAAPAVAAAPAPKSEAPAATKNEDGPREKTGWRKYVCC